MQRHDHGILRRGAGGGNERKELRCRNCTHVANFPSSSGFEQGKKTNDLILERRGNALPGPFNASPDINRLPLLAGFRIFHRATRVDFHRARNSMSSTLRPCLRFPETLVRQEA